LEKEYRKDKYNILISLKENESQNDLTSYPSPEITIGMIGKAVLAPRKTELF
jgi:hypothetical protein